MDSRLRKGLERSAPLQVAAAVALLLLILKMIYPTHPRITFSRGDRLLVADFVNYTGDAELATRLKALLGLSLEQSAYVTLYPEAKVRYYMKRVLRNRNSPIPAEVARQVCVGEGIPVFLLPRLRRLGSSFIVSAELFEVEKQNLKEFPADTLRARDENELLLAMDELSERVRTTLGESANAVEMTRNPLSPYSTRSQTALQLFARALALHAERNFEEEGALLKQAVSLDRSFALAHMRLASFYRRTMEYDAAVKHLILARENSSTLSPKARLKLLGSHYSLTHQFPKAIEQYQSLVAKYPNDWEAPFELARINLGAGDLHLAVELCQKAIQLDDSHTEAHLALAMAHLYNQDSAAARKAWERAAAWEPSDVGVLLTGGFIDLVENNLANAVHEFEKVVAQPSPQLRSLGYFLMAQAQIYGGRFGSALSNLQSGIEADKRLGATAWEADKRLSRTRIFQLLGDTTQALNKARQMPPPGTDPVRLGNLGAVYANLGRLDEARSLLREIEALPSLPRKTIEAELLRGEIELGHGRADTAVIYFTRAKEMQPRHAPSLPLARALASAGRWVEAEAEYRAICEHKAEMLFPGGMPQFTGTWTQALFETGNFLRQRQKKEEANQFFRNYLWVMDGSDPGLKSVEDARSFLRMR